MTWIDTIAYQKSEGRLRKLYDRVKGPGDNVDNIMLAHSLRPHTMEGHMTLYKYVLHHPKNTVPKWILEALGVFTSMLNECDYCVDHHFEGMKRLLGDDARSSDIRKAFDSNDLSIAFDARQVAAFEYARDLTLDAARVSPEHMRTLRTAGWDDGEILEINQVVAYFNYANRTVLGLGIDTRGDILGLSPSESEDMENWQHR